MFKYLLGTVVLMGFALVAAPAQATIVSYDITTAFSGAQSFGTPPLIHIELDDTAAPGAVRMTASAPGLDPTEWVARLAFNLDPTFDASQLTFNNFEILAGTMLQAVASRANDQFECDNGGFFDLQFVFSVSGGGFTRRWNQGETFRIDIGGIPGLTANSFNFPSTPPATNGTQPVALLIQGIGPLAEEGWHSVPEPGSALALLAVVALSGVRARRR